MRLFIAALIEIAGLALVAGAAYALHPAAGMAVAGVAMAWFGAELARGSGR